MDDELKRYWFWSEPFYKALEQLDVKRVWSSGLRSHFQCEAHIYGLVLGTRLDRDAETNPVRSGNRINARNEYFNPRSRKHNVLVSGNPEKWDFENDAAPGSHRFEVEQAERESIDALRRWIDT